MEENSCFCCKLPLQYSSEVTDAANDDHFSVFVVLKANEENMVHEEESYLTQKREKKRKTCCAFASCLCPSDEHAINVNSEEQSVTEKLQLHDQLLKIDGHNVGVFDYPQVVQILSGHPENTLVELLLGRSDGSTYGAAIKKRRQGFGFTLAESNLAGATDSFATS